MRKSILFSKFIGVSLALGVMVHCSAVLAQELTLPNPAIKEFGPSESARVVAGAVDFSLRALTQSQCLTGLELLLRLEDASYCYFSSLLEQRFLPPGVGKVLPASELFRRAAASEIRLHQVGFLINQYPSDPNERMEVIIFQTDESGPIGYTDHDRRRFRRDYHSVITGERFQGGIGP